MKLIIKYEPIIYSITFIQLILSHSSSFTFNVFSSFRYQLVYVCNLLLMVLEQMPKLSVMLPFCLLHLHIFVCLSRFCRGTQPHFNGTTKFQKRSPTSHTMLIHVHVFYYSIILAPDVRLLLFLFPFWLPLPLLYILCSMFHVLSLLLSLLVPLLCLFSGLHSGSSNSLRWHQTYSVGLPLTWLKP